MPKVTVGLISLSLLYGPFAFAQQTTSLAAPNFPPAGYLQVPPHFQPRPMGASHVVKTAPPPIPSYAQPAIPEEGYLWMPGFWARRDDVRDYYWVPGTWVKPPRPGLLWTPPYWSRIDGGYAFHAGYWDETVGFYGGIRYGYGYAGDGYQGGRWDNGTFFYNRAANDLGSLNIAHIYDQPIADADPSMNIGFSGGSHGTGVPPTLPQESPAPDRHLAPTAEQQQHFEMAAKNRSLYSKLNHDEPGIAATSRAGVFDGRISRSNAFPDGQQSNPTTSTHTK